MIVFITGGAKNGKSSYAQDLAVKLAQGGRHYYLATMVPCDEEDRARIRHHLADREGALVCTVMDARRSQVYNAVFRIEGGRPVRLRPDRAIALSVLLDEMQAADAPCYLVGDGAALCEAAFAQAGLKTLPVPAPLRMQSAWGVAMAAADKTPGDAADLTPNYLRLSQAERERLERLQKDAQE